MFQLGTPRSSGTADRHERDFTRYRSSPTDIQPVLDTLLASAVKLSGAKQGHIRQADGEFLRVGAHYNESPERIAILIQPVTLKSKHSWCSSVPGAQTNSSP